MGKCEFCGQVLPKKKIPKSLTQFLELIENQFVYGGTKYAQTKEKEATDVLFDDFGKGWLLGTVAKYCKRFSNLARERDLLKIACYEYILWLKRGFHLKKEGSYTIINTTVETKSKYFKKFIDSVISYIENNKIDKKNVITQIYDILKELNDTIFILTKEEKYLQIFQLAYYIWNKEIKEKGKDEDVFNESKLKENVK